MILYHGSNVEVREPHLLKIQRDLDFGRGFYTTSDFDQAASWARRSVRIRKNGHACVSCYQIDEKKLAGLKILEFKKADEAWLEFVASNRRGINSQDNWDLVVGPVVNDQTFPTILLYLDGYLDARSAIERLLPQKLKDQHTFKTNAALSLLSCVEVRRV